MMKREELSRIASVKFQKALSDRARAVTPRVLAFCVMAVSLVFTLAVTAANLRLTYVTDSDGARQLVVSSETDPARVMSLSGIEAEEGDHVYYTAFSGNLATLNIERAFTVNIQADGQEYPVKMAFGTVADALERAGITLEADDYTEPALDQLVTAGSEITVHRVDYQDKVETQTIPYDTQYVYTSLYFRNTGRATTLQHGAEGQQTVTTREKYVDGELENSMVVDVTTTVEPTDHVIKTYGAGAPVSPLTGPDGTTNAPASYSQVLTGKATGYYSRTGKGSSGLGLGYGTVAVDPLNLASAYFGALLAAAALSALGCAVSCLIPLPAAAYLVSVFFGWLLIFFNPAPLFSPLAGVWPEMPFYLPSALDFSSRYQSFTDGYFGLDGVFYFVSLTAALLAFNWVAVYAARRGR